MLPRPITMANAKVTVNKIHNSASRWIDSGTKQRKQLKVYSEAKAEKQAKNPKASFYTQ